MKRLVIKITNPRSNEKQKYVEQCVHDIQDTLNEICKMKGAKARSFDVDYCSAVQMPDGEIIDEELSNYLEM